MNTVATSDFHTVLRPNINACVKIFRQANILSHHRSLDAFFDIVACRKIVARAQLWFSVRKVYTIQYVKIRIGICVLVNINNKRVFKLVFVVVSVTLIPEIFFLQIDTIHVSNM